jgi:hypothetical protein
MTLSVLALVMMMGAQPFNQTFALANEAYEAGDYEVAVARYEQLVAERVYDADVFYNLGNAYFKEGLLGPAIANYERALQLDPRNEDAASNLETALGMTKRHLEKPSPSAWRQSLFFWHYGLGLRTLRIAALIGWTGLWAVLALRQWRPLRYTRLAVTMLAAVAAASTVSVWAKTHPASLAVASAVRVPVRYSPEKGATLRFELYEGDRVVIDGQKDGWVRVTTAGGERGWTHRDNLAFVGPPYCSPAVPPNASVQEEPPV